jgi:hypothetical protein
MAIRIATRATISDAFKEKWMEVCRQRLLKMKNVIDDAPPYVRDGLKQRINPKAQRLIGIINDKSKLDREITKLRSLPYAAFDYQNYKGREFLYGKTKEIIITASARQKYDAGEYGVYAPLSRLVEGSLNSNVSWHFIPFREPKSHQRTPHHHNGWHNEGLHPLETNSATCWGSFGPVIPSILEDGDVVELFRILYIYVSRYDPHSPLGGISPMSFAKQI